MKVIYTLLLVSLSLFSFSQGISNLNLKLTGDLFYSRTPGNNSAIKFTLKNKLQTALVITTDNTNDKRLEINESFSHGKGRQGNLVVISQLFGFTDNTVSKTFRFGRASAENNLDNAVVTVFYANGLPTQKPSLNRRPVNFKVGASEIFSVSPTGTSSASLTGERFLKVEASAAETATIEIEREAGRGNVIIGIFSVRNGNLLATLNPKDPENQSKRLSFTTDEPVLVVPVIRPAVNSSNGIDTVHFDAGDPVENATIETVEE